MSPRLHSLLIALRRHAKLQSAYVYTLESFGPNGGLSIVLHQTLYSTPLFGLLKEYIYHFHLDLVSQNTTINQTART
jgi:hypothetical protein